MGENGTKPIVGWTEEGDACINDSVRDRTTFGDRYILGEDGYDNHNIIPTLYPIRKIFSS